MTNGTTIPEARIHHILSNPRRRKTLEYLSTTNGTISVRELSEAIAEVESGEDPPPRDVRKAVYVSLHQTHLPVLDEEGVVNYDRTGKEITLLDTAHDIRVYMEVVTNYGITWAGYYRGLGVVALFTLLASLVGIPGISAIPPTLLVAAFLSVFALSTCYHFWKQRGFYLRDLSLP